MRIDITNIFEGEKVTILGGGYSLLNFDFSRVKGKVIAVNYSALNYPKADVLVSCDSFIHSKNPDFINSFKGYKVTDREPVLEGVHKLIYEGIAMTNSDRDLEWYCQNTNMSGFVALALAFHLGAKKVYLLGYDGGFDKISNHYYHNSNVTSLELEKLNVNYEFFKDYPIVNVVNPECMSKIEYFKKVDINTNFYEHDTANNC